MLIRILQIEIMNSIKKYIFIALGLLAVLILLPVILAPILHISHVDSYFNYGGKESDWIAFWGNYLGAVITGIISYVILWYTIKTNKEENQSIISANQAENTRILKANASLEETKQVQEYIVRFSNDVAKRLSKFDLSKFGGVFVEFDSSYKDSKKRLESYHSQLIEDLNSFKILYNDERHNDFLKDYQNTIEIITNRIQDFMILYNDLDKAFLTGNLDSARDLQDKLKEKTNKLVELNPVINKLYGKAIVEIDKLKNKDISVG